ncbi:hypothetical protein [Pelodictyon luteolum]|nr:hypothetical protein [Pelodictyon luteolum]
MIAKLMTCIALAAILNAAPVYGGGAAANKEMELIAPKTGEVDSVGVGSNGLCVYCTNISCECITRRVEPLWTWTLQDEHFPILQTRYCVKGPDGRRDVFINPENPSSPIIVHLKPMGIKAVEYINDQWLMHEGVELVLQLPEDVIPGRYDGVITALITITNI